MKIFIWLLITFLLYSIGTIFGIWVSVSFLIYLVKDIPFSWWTLWVCVCSTVLGILSNLYLLAIEAIKIKQGLQNTYPESKFMSRLREKLKENEQSKT